MHSITLDTAASVLLLSSVVSIGLVLKRTPKSRLKSSNSILSISDVSSSIFTAVMLLFHQFFVDNDNDIDYRINKLNNTRYFDETLYKSTSSREVNSTSPADDLVEKCDYKSVLLQYAMFLIPFVNAFISLLSFSTSFHASAMTMSCRCRELADCCQEDVEKSVDKRENRTEVFDSASDVGKRRIDANSARSNTKKPTFFDGKYTNFAIIGQWLIPALLTSVFQFGEYQRINVSRGLTEDLICTITANFPFENCIEHLNSTFETSKIDSIGSYSSVDNYASIGDHLLWLHQNSTEVSDVVSKIYSVVQSVMNDSEMLDATLPDRHYNVAQLLDITNRQHLQNVTTSKDFNFGANPQPLNFTKDANNLTEKNKQTSYVMHSFEDKVLHSDEQLELHEMLVTQCLKNRCTISTKFLKMYFFLLLTLIYFAPIFASALILVKTNYTCREITAKLQSSKSKLEPEMKRCTTAREERATETNTRQRLSNALQPGWFSENADEEIEQAVEDTEQLEQKQPTEARSTFETIACELTRETEKMQSLFNMFKANILVAVALWTPFFFQILSKIFLCSNVPIWLMQTTFLATIIFSIFKNAMNVNVINVETEAKNAHKDNSIHPSKLDFVILT